MCKSSAAPMQNNSVEKNVEEEIHFHTPMIMNMVLVTCGILVVLVIGFLFMRYMGYCKRRNTTTTSDRLEAFMMSHPAARRISRYHLREPTTGKFNRTREEADDVRIKEEGNNGHSGYRIGL